MANGLAISTLGGLVIRHNETAIQGFASRKTELLLVYLACNPRPWPREVLADLLWDDRSQSQAMANLRVTLSSLRQTVGDYVDITRHTAGIRPGAPLTLDVSQLADAAANFRRQQASGRASGAAARLQEILALVAGDFLQGISIRDARGLEEWQLVQRERCRNMTLEASEALGAWALAGGDLELALTTVARHLQWDALSEAGYRQQMEALARSGRRADALAAGERCRLVLWQELGLEPAAETVAVLQAIQSGELQAQDAPVTVARSLKRRDLPHPSTPLIGRNVELAEVNALLSDSARLLTIVGPGGMGKTRLALEAAREQSPAFAGGAAFVDLTVVTAIEGIVYAIAAALRLNIDNSGSVTAERQLLDHLHDDVTLLVLDNFEHLLEGAPLLHRIVNEAHGVRLLVTSREPLQLAVEHLYPLQGLAYTPHQTSQAAEKDGAVALFLHHARRASPGYALDNEQLPALWRLMDLLGGLPLAIILASSWAPLLSLADIVAETRQNLDFLAASYADLPPRQQTMRAVFTASWARLSAAEQAIFAALSVFRGGFTLEAAREVAQATPRQLLNLLQRTLLISPGEGRFMVHELLRQFAAEELARLPEQQEAVHERHSVYFCRFLHHRERAMRSGVAQQTAREIAAEFENARLAINWAARARRGALLAQTYALGFYCSRVDRPREAAAFYRHIVDALVGCTSAIEMRVQAMAMSAYTLFAPREAFQGHEDSLKAALHLLEKAGILGEDVRFEVAFTQAILGYFLSFKAVEQARTLYEHSLSIFSELGYDSEMAWVYSEFAHSYFQEGKLHVAREYRAKVLDLRRRIGDEFPIYDALVKVAYIDLQLGRSEEAMARIRLGLSYFERSGMAAVAATTHLQFARALAEQGQFGESQEHAQIAEAYFRRRPEAFAFIPCVVSKSWATLNLGHFEEAAGDNLQILPLLMESGNQAMLGRLLSTLGSAAIATAHVEEAAHYLEDSMRAFTACGDRLMQTQVLPQMAVVAYLQGNLPLAYKRIADALRLNIELRLPKMTLVLLASAALLLAHAGNTVRAIELYALACQYPHAANSLWYETVFAQRLAMLSQELPEDEIVSARARGAALDLFATLEDLYAQFAAENPLQA